MVASFTSQLENDVWDVADHGFVAGTVRIPDIATSSVPTGGTIYYNKFQVRRAVTITQAFLNITTTGATPTAGQNWLGIYDSSGNKIAEVSTDANVTGTNLQTITFSAPVQLNKGFYWVAMLWNALTVPTIHRITLATASTANANLAASQKSQGSTAAQTVLPATTDPTTWSNTFNTWGIWFA